MKQLYIVAENAISVSVDDGLAAWEAVEPRFRPFAAASADRPVLAVEIAAGALPQPGGELIFETRDAGVGFVMAGVWRLADGSDVLVFRHIDEAEPRLWMKMSRLYDRAEIVIAPDGDGNDPYFLSHALMIAFMLATCGNGTLVIHAASVLKDGRAYLFQGKSGTGKSTHASLWVKNIVGAELLNDDNPMIRFNGEGVAMAYGSPWSGKTACYRNVSAPIGAFVRIVRAKENELRRLAPLKAYASLTASVFYMPFLSDRLWEVRHKTIERLVATVTCCEMHCLPNADAAKTCAAGVL